MTTYPELAARTDLTVHTPNEQLSARLRGKYDVTITIAPGYAERVGDREMAVQLGRLSRLLFMHRADRLNQVAEETMQPGARRPVTAKDQEFERRYDEITVTETSADQTVTLTSVGMRTWSWELRPGTVDRWGGEQVARSATEVANLVARRLAEEVRRLKITVYHAHG